jgi:3-oxoacyl-[acyl-carrier protein] reductase
MGALDDRGNLAGRKAVVIGGGGGIGKAITLALGEAQVDVAFCDVDSAALISTKAELTALGRHAVAEIADATDPAALQRFYQAVEAAFGHADIVVNVVGGVLMKPFMEKTPEVCAQDIQRNYGYVLDSTRLAVPLLRKSGRGGCIINFTTIEAHRGAGGFAVYAGAKAATTNFSKAMAWELGPERIRVNVVAPDTTASEGNRKALPPQLQAVNEAVPPEWWVKAMAMYIPLGVPPSREDLANAVLFLASDLATSITGQVIHVDGGTAAALGMLRWPFDGDITLPVPAGATLAKLFGPR